MRKRLFIWMTLIMIPASLAQDLGNFGEVFTIQERNLLEVIQEKLLSLQASGKIETHQREIQKRVREKIMHPDPVLGITQTQKPRRFTFDPTLVVPHDLKDHDGQVFHKAGTQINPLTIRPLTKPLLFIDGDDERQIHWALAQCETNPKTKVILVKGSPFECEKNYHQLFYFDQAGLLTKKFGITQVPARLQQEGDHLVIEELKLTEGAKP